MKRLLLAVALLPFGSMMAVAQNVPTGDAAAGKALWDNEVRCKACHGDLAEGAFGPSLAGRGLSYTQVHSAVRQPLGIMPQFIDEQVSDQELANLTAYFASLPKAAKPSPWKTEVPANAPAGQSTMISLGCGQCHGDAMVEQRGYMGAVNADVNWLKDIVYNHTSSIRPFARSLNIGNGPARLHMGNFNPDRISEAQLTSIMDWIKSSGGFRAAMRGRLTKGEQSENGVTYTLNVQNFGLAGKGLTAESVTVSLMIPEGSNVVAATGQGYKGVRMDAKEKAQVAEWAWPKADPQDKQTYTITLSKAGTQKNNLRGRISWEKPVIKPSPTGDQADIPGAPL